jgi:ATP-dependent Zn protease
MSKRREWHTAIHEAGHAVIGRMLGMVCGQVTIIPNLSEETAGVAITHDQWVTFGAWEKRDKYRDVSSVVRGRIMTLMAGAEAEVVCIGRCRGGDTDDRFQVALMMEEIRIPNDDIVRYARRLRAKTRALVQRHRHKIEHVAKALTERRTISGKNVDRLLRQVTSAEERRVVRRVRKARRKQLRELFEVLHRSPAEGAGRILMPGPLGWMPPQAS